MPERGPFLDALVRQGLPLRIYGPLWRRARGWSGLPPYLHDGYLDDEAYVATIASAKIALALLSAENQDLHTTRSLEIPAIGTLLCGERTEDHLALYDDGAEAVFWSTPEECAATCFDLLAAPERLERMASAGRERALRNGCFNEPVLDRIVRAACTS